MDQEQGARGRADARAGATPVGKRLRSILLDVSSAGLSHRAEALLYAADRAEHVDTVVRPALERGAVVISDRYIDSSVAYQGAGRDLSPTEIARINRWATNGLVPHLTVLLDVAPEAARERFTEAPDRLESEPAEFHARVRSGFPDPGRGRPRSLPRRGRGPGARGRHHRRTPPARPGAAAFRGRDQGPGGGTPQGRGGGAPQGRGRGRAQGRGGAPGARAPRTAGRLRAEEEERKRRELEGGGSGARPSGRRRRPGSGPRKRAGRPRRSGHGSSRRRRHGPRRRRGAGPRRNGGASRPRRRSGCGPRPRPGAWRSSARPRRP